MKRASFGAAALGFLAVEVKRKLRFSAATVWGTVSTFVLYVIEVSLWGYIGLGTDPGYVARYFAVVAFLRPMLNVRADSAIGARHASGEVVYDTTRPLSLFQILLVGDVAAAIVALATVGLPTLAAISLLFDVGSVAWNMVPLFLVSSALAFIAGWSLAFVIGCSAFYLKDTNGVLSAYHFLFPFLSGAMIPLEALPAPFRLALELLPFRCAYDLPIRVLNAPGAVQALQAIAIQLAWCVGLVAVALRVETRSLRRLEVYGG